MLQKQMQNLWISVVVRRAKELALKELYLFKLICFVEIGDFA